VQAFPCAAPQAIPHEYPHGSGWAPLPDLLQLPGPLCRKSLRGLHFS